MRTSRLIWLRTRAASSALWVTTLSAPTRSPYSENDLENEFDTSTGRPASAKRRTAAPSASMPVTEALVGDVEEGHEVARLHDGDHLGPTARA